MNFTSVSGKTWLLRKFNSTIVKDISEQYSLNEIVAKIISIRNKDIENIEVFLNPTIKNLMPNPFLLKDMQVGINRIYKSITKRETIGIFGDYDVDGASSTALLKKYFSSIDLNNITYIPDRKKEGYGPTINGFNSLIKSGSKVIITVDCGTLSFEPVKTAQENEVDVIILDHHQSDISLPKAHALINPNRYDETSELNYLCAAGVCFMFLVALNKKLRDENWFVKNSIKEPNVLDFLDLVSLGTVCDVVPLIGLNRALVKQGLKVIKKRLNLGLKTLYDLCNIKSHPSTYDLGYVLGPRINAGGRVGKSSHGVDLLSSSDPQKAFKIASDLEKYNTERKSIEYMLSEKIMIEAEKCKDDSVLVLSGENWHEGIIGIIASRIKDKYNKPTIIISINNDVGKASARSIFGFDIGTQIISAVQNGIVKRGGGHKMAAGFTIKKNNINKLKDFLNKNFNKLKINLQKNKTLKLDSLIAASAINEEFYDEVNYLAPFGAANSEPKFAVENLKVISNNFVGQKHIKAILCAKDGFIFKCIAFNAKNTPLEQYLNKKNNKLFNIAGKLKLNEWNGKRNIEFEIEDISIN